MSNAAGTLVCEDLSLIGTSTNGLRFFFLNGQLAKFCKFILDRVLNIDNFAALSGGECIDYWLILHTYGHFIRLIEQLNLALKLIRCFGISF
jgi:hypothetical protein